MKSKQAEVSLIICGYNGESTIKAALDSVVSQTLNSMEVLCIDDASPDNMLEIFNEYARKYPFVKVIKHPLNKGLFAARQTGVKHASGKYIMFLDQDDALLPESCLELSRQMNESGADMVQFDAELKFESEECRMAREKEVSDFFRLKSCKTLNSSDEILKACFIDKKFTWNVWNKIYKADLARKVYAGVPDDRRIVMAEDTLAVFLAASMAEKMEFSSKKYYIYSVGVGVSGVSVLKNEESSLDVFYSLIKPYADKLSSETAHKVADGLGKQIQRTSGWNRRHE